jgi:hypothetical protein
VPLLAWGQGVAVPLPSLHHCMYISGNDLFLKKFVVLKYMQAQVHTYACATYFNEEFT